MTQSLSSGWSLWLAVLLVAGGSALVAISAHWIVESGAAVARILKVPEAFVGLTILAAGTSAPEFAVTIMAAFQGYGSIAVSNVVGSNIFNLGLILGGVAILAPMATNRVIVWRDGSVLFGATALLVLVSGFDLHLGLLDGIILLAVLAAYLGNLLVRAHRSSWMASGTRRRRLSRRKILALLSRHGSVLVGAILLMLLAAHLLIGGATSLAERFGLSEWVIGVTVVAAGTSIPEFATSLAAAVKRPPGLGLGNIIGSDIFNILGVLGLTGVLHSVDVAPAATGSLLALSLMVLLAILFMRTHWTLSRAEGFLLVALGLARWILDFSLPG